MKKKDNKLSALKLADFFIDINKDFDFIDGSNFTKIKSDFGNFLFYSEEKNKYLLAAGNQIKAQVAKAVSGKHAEIAHFCTYSKIANHRLYNTDLLNETGFQYDLNAAYTHMIRMLWISDATFKRLLELKYKYNFNINKAIGIALLGTKTIRTYKAGIKQSEKTISNPLTPCFMLVRYLIIRSIEYTLKHDFSNIAIAHYVDALILSERVEAEFLQKKFFENLIYAFEVISWEFEQDFKLNFFETFGTNLERIKSFDFNFFNFKENEIKELNVSKSEWKKLLSFVRNDETITYKSSSFENSINNFDEKINFLTEKNFDLRAFKLNLQN